MNQPANIHSPAKADRSSTLRRSVVVAQLLCVLAALPPVALGGEAAIPSQLEAERLDGTRYSLAESRGSITVLAVWSPDSLASRKSLGELQRFATLFQPRGVSVLAISAAGDTDRLRRFAAERRLNLPMAILGSNDFGPLPEQGLPLVYVFDRDGRHRATHGGLFRLRTLEQLVAPLL